jgi:nucleoside-diphosphate-sugar epimerase
VEELAELIRNELGASADLVTEIEQPDRMTLVKRPTLERQRTTLGVEPKVSLEEGIARVCREIRRRIAA